MQVFVINLERDIARRASITAQLDGLGLAHEFVSAVDGQALSPEERAADYDDSKAKWRQARALLPAEIGCALSHLKVYRAIIERACPYALVLEDDVVVPEELGGFLGSCTGELNPARPEVWLLSPAFGRMGSGAARPVGPRHWLLPYRSGFYASSYLATNAAARCLLDELYPVGDVADCWERMHRYRVADLFVVSPSLIKQDQVTFGSSTTSDYKHSVGKGVVPRVAYKARRLRNILWEVIYTQYRRRMRCYPDLELRNQRTV